jgi:ParB-like chromosome segregation protein Spo0J
MTIRNRIVDHVQVRAGDLVPHPDNFREHPYEQRQALADSYSEVGFARSLLGYRRGDGRIQLIDGHLRRDFDPDMQVVVEVLDVTEEEASKLLLTIDPLAALASTNAQAASRLVDRVKTSSESLNRLWTRLRDDNAAATAHLRKKPKTRQEVEDVDEKFLVLVECQDETKQVALLRRFREEGLECKALIS